MRAVWVTAVALLAALMLSACALLPPTPSNEQIVEAIQISNDSQEVPLELVYEEMQVPHRYPGKANAVVWVADESIQRNFLIAYNKESMVFYVESFTTLVLGEDGSYREEDL